jgi:AcrR family transcriptional regulator
MKNKEAQEIDRLAGGCLAAFIAAGSLDLSLDRLAEAVKTSKRMLIHYFGNRENLEERAVELLENRLRQQFSPERFPAGTPFAAVVHSLWEQSTVPASRQVLLLIMDVSRRAWSGSARARIFYAEQQRLWVEMLSPFLPNNAAVEQFLQLFQGAIMAYLITGDVGQGSRALDRFIETETYADGRP